MIFVLRKDYKSEEQSGEGKSVLAALPEGNIERKRIRDGCVEICTTAHGGAGGVDVRG